MSDGKTSGGLVSVKHAAEQLGMARSSLYRLCKDGKVPSYAAGSKGFGVRVDIQEAKAALRRPVQVDTEEEEESPRLEDDEPEFSDDRLDYEEEQEFPDDDEDECELEVREMDAFDHMTGGEL